MRSLHTMALVAGISGLAGVIDSPPLDVSASSYPGIDEPKLTNHPHGGDPTFTSAHTAARYAERRRKAKAREKAKARARSKR